MVKIITQTEELDHLCRQLMDIEFVAIDTEFVREKTYYPNLCLVQIAATQTEFVIDPLAENLDLSPLWTLLRSPITKVFHAARQDLEIFFHMGGFVPENIFDTQIASMVLNAKGHISYASLVEWVLEVELNKKARFSDWSKRPLNQEQLQYAIDDVTYLRDLYPVLRSKLHKLDRASWIVDEHNFLMQEELYLCHPKDAYKRLKIRSRKKSYLSALVKTAAWREETAQKIDRPRSHILKDEAVQAIALQSPKTAEQLDNIRTLPRGFARSKFATALLKRLSDPEMDFPDSALKAPAVSKRIDEGRLNLLKLLCEIICEDQKIAMPIIGQTKDLQELAHYFDRSGPGADRHHSAMEEGRPRLLTGWRKSVLGDQAMALLAGKISLGLRDGKIDLIDQRESD